MRNIERDMRNAICEMRNIERDTRNAICEMRNIERDMRNAICEMRWAKCDTRMSPRGLHTERIITGLAVCAQKNWDVIFLTQ